VHKIFYPI